MINHLFEKMKDTRRIFLFEIDIRNAKCSEVVVVNLAAGFAKKYLFTLMFFKLFTYKLLLSCFLKTYGIFDSSAVQTITTQLSCFWKLFMLENSNEYRANASFLLQIFLIYTIIFKTHFSRSKYICLHLSTSKYILYPPYLSLVWKV